MAQSAAEAGHGHFYANQYLGNGLLVRTPHRPQTAQCKFVSITIVGLFSLLLIKWSVTLNRPCFSGVALQLSPLREPVQALPPEFQLDRGCRYGTRISQSILLA